MSSLKKVTVNRTLWASVDLFGQQGIQFFVSIILARLLEPSEFGLLAMLAIFTSSATVLVEGGFVAALIALPEVSHSAKSTIFWYNLLLGIIFVSLFWFTAPAIANFYNQPRLIPIIHWSIWTIFINCLGVVHRAMLQKSLRFREQSIVSVVSIVLSGLITVFMAVKGYGVWALVAQALTVSLFQVFGLWIIYPWRPNIAFDVKAFKEVFAFSHNLMFSNIIRMIFQNIYQMIIGKGYSATLLGYYYRSKRFTMLASQLPTTVIQRVCFPTLSKFQNNSEKMVQGYKQFLGATMLFVVPLLAGLSITAPNFIWVLIGEKWLPSVPYIRLLCLSGIFLPIHILSCSTLAALDKPREYLRTEIIKYVLITLSIIGMYKLGIIALLAGEAVSSFLSAIVSFFYVSKYLKISIFEPFKWLAPIIFSGIVMVISLAFIMPENFAFSALALKTVIGIVVYFGTLILFRYPLVTSGIKTLWLKFL